jgi:hypothetical protein
MALVLGFELRIGCSVNILELMFKVGCSVCGLRSEFGIRCSICVLKSKFEIRCNNSVPELVPVRLCKCSRSLKECSKQAKPPEDGGNLGIIHG